MMTFRAVKVCLRLVSSLRPVGSHESEGLAEHAKPRRSLRTSQLLAFSPGKEQAAGVWETCLAPGGPQLRSGLPFGPRSQANLQRA